MYENCFLDRERVCGKDCAAFVGKREYTHCKVLNGLNVIANVVRSVDPAKAMRRRHHPKSPPPPEVHS